MNDMGAKIATLLAIATVTSIPLLAQRPDYNPNAQQNTPAAGAQGEVGFGDQSASHAWEMSSINAELEGKLDSKTAKVGDHVALKTIDKVQTSDGTIIPKGSHLVGQITAVQAYDRDQGGAMIAIAFDHVEIKGGGSAAVFTLIRGAMPGANPDAMNTMGPMGSNDTMGATTAGNGRMGSQQGMGGMGGGRNGGVLGGTGGAVGNAGGGAGGVADGTVDRTTGTAGGLGDPIGANPNGTVETAGHGEVDPNPSAHQAAAERARPRPTGFPGVMLSGNSTASGVFSCSRQNVHFDGGTQIQLGIVAE
jgi:hypothetical protein